MRESMNEVEMLLRARIGCIWINSFEEEDIINDLKEVMRNQPQQFQGYSLNIWSHTEGVTKIPLSEYEEATPPNPKLRELPALFSVISGSEKGDGGSSNLWILRDFHTMITDAKAQRYIRDLKEYPSNHYNPLIVIAPAVNLPSDVARLFRVVDYELPKEDLIKSMVQASNLQLSGLESNNPEKGYHAVSTDVLKEAVRACTGLTKKEIEMNLKESIIKYKTLDTEFLSQSKIQIVKKTGVLDYKIPHTKLADIGGNQAIKEWLAESHDAFSEEARAFGVDKPKGAMLVGIPGSGKTAIAEAFAAEEHLPLLELSMSKIMDKLVGQSERKIDQALQVVKACAPCVFLLDEVEKMLGAAGAGGSSNQSDGGVTNRVFQSILKFMNDNDSGVYVLMTSNDVSQLPPEFTRPGRVDAIWYFGLPTAEERRSIFKIHFGLKNKNVGDIVLNEAVKDSKGYTGAEIQQVVKNAVSKAYRHFKEDGNDNITKDDIRIAAEEVIPVSVSSREKIAALDNYCRSRFRSTSGEVKEAPKKKDDTGFLLDL